MTRASATSLEWFFWTGMRPGEIRSLTWEALDRETWTLRLHPKDAKTGYGRVISLEDDLRAVIERRVRARRLDCPCIFHRAGHPVGEFRKTWKAACKAAGLAVTVERAGKEITAVPKTTAYVASLPGTSKVVPLRAGSGPP